MMIKDGGPAFPVPAGYPGVGDGMSLRDFLAAAALQGMAQRYPHTGTAGMIASAAYILADAMIAQRDVIDASFEVKK